ncbi:hypothetical protein [Pedobacter sp. UC225_65]
MWYRIESGTGRNSCSDPAEMCYLGWQESLEKLMKLVEPEIPDA